MSRAKAFVSGAVAVAMSVWGCGEGGFELGAAGQSDDAALSIRSGAPAYRVLLQKSPTSVKPGQTNGFGFDFVCSYGPGVTAGPDVPKDSRTPAVASIVYVSDCGNKRILLFDSAATSGAEAIGVLGQRDFFEHRSPATVAGVTGIGDERVHLGDEGRLYVFNGSRVLVYNDPVAAAATPGATWDYVLQDLPTSIRHIHNISGNRLLVVGARELAFYRVGDDERLAQWRADLPKVGAGSCNILDATVVGRHALFSCDAGLTGSDFCVKGGATGVDTCVAVRMRSLATTGAGRDLTNYDTAPSPDAVITGTSGVFIGALPDDSFRPGRLLALESSLFIRGVSGNRAFRFDAGQTGLEAYLDRLATDKAAPTAHTASSVRLIGQDPLDASEILGDGCNRNEAPVVVGVTADRHLCGGVAMTTLGGNVWLIDKSNHRALRFSAIGASGAGAEMVLGQGNAQVRTRNSLEAGAALSVSGVAVVRTGDADTLHVADTTGNRVLVFEDIAASANGPEPERVHGQVDKLQQIPTSGSEGRTRPRSIASDGGIVVTADNGNFRLLVDRNGDGKISGGGDLSIKPSVLNMEFGAIAVRGSTLYVATREEGDTSYNRVFYYALNTASSNGLPDRVFGQAQIVLPTDSAGISNIPNLPNHGGKVRADNFKDVSALAVDEDGRLWVGDRGNRRILWFDSPNADDGGDLNALIEAVTADGVLGQVDFGPSAGNPSAPDDASVAGVSALAITKQGGLWVGRGGRAVFFPTPMVKEEGELFSKASTILGRQGFDSGIKFKSKGSILLGIASPSNAATLSSVTGIALDETDRHLFIADSGNYRVVHHYLNTPPAVTFKEGDDPVQRLNLPLGTAKTITVVPTDAEDDALDTPVLVSRDSRVALSGSSLTITSAGGDVGDSFSVTVDVTDKAVRAETGRGLLQVTVIARAQDQASAGTPPGAQVPVEVDTGCRCSWEPGATSGGAGKWAVIALLGGWALRRRRRL